jgi:hypothetical protein
MKGAMSAIGPKRTSLLAPHMSAFGGKADICLPLLAEAFSVGAAYLILPGNGVGLAGVMLLLLVSILPPLRLAADP